VSTQLAAECVLAGGLANRGRVVRVGDTVRRPARPTSASTHALLLHLEARGFGGAPRYLGMDEKGREVLSYVEGEVGGVTSQEILRSDAALVSVAHLLRLFHAEVAGFDPSPWSWERQVPLRYCGGMVSHNDPNVDNVVFRDGTAVALIDFDLAAPGSPLWDVALAARLWAPLRARTDVAPDLRDRRLDRLRLFVDAYGLPGKDRPALVDAVIATVGWAYDLVREAVEDGHPGFTYHWRSGGGARAVRSQVWFGQARDLLMEVVC
jgi:Phosphotransferase enzyme family